MRSQGVYEVTSLEEGKVNQRDQSYRSCLLSLLIFFFLCIILIFATLPWRKNHSYNSNFENSNSGSAEEQHRVTKVTSTTEMTKHVAITFTVSTESNEPETTITEDPTVIDITGQNVISSKFETLLTSSVPDDKIFFPEEVIPPGLMPEEKTIFPEEEILTSSVATVEAPTNKLYEDLTTNKYIEKNSKQHKTSITQLSSTTTSSKLAKATSFTVELGITDNLINTTTPPTTTTSSTIAATTSSTIAATTPSTITTTSLTTITSEEEITIKSTTDSPTDITAPATITTPSTITSPSTTTTTIPSTTITQRTTTVNSRFVPGTSPPDELEAITDSVTNSTTKSKEESTIPSMTDSPTNVTAPATITTPSTITSPSTTTTTIPSTTITQRTTTVNSRFVPDTSPPDELEAITDSVTNSTTKSKEESTIPSMTDSPTNVTTHTTTTTLPTITSPLTTTTTISSVTTTTPSTNPVIATNSGYREKREVCTTGKCKKLASKMLFYMNHDVDPCDDFYEYACGSFEANPQTVNLDLESIAYQRILGQMEKVMKAGNSSLFIKYYNSCMQYETVNQTERIREARKVLDRIGKFYTTTNFNRSNVNFTKLVAQMLLYNSPLLFDVSPTFNKQNPDMVTLKIGPSKYSNPFETEDINNSCYASRQERDQEKLDLEELYEEYKKCKKDSRKFINSIRDALTALGVFNELNNPYNISQYVNTTVNNINFEIVQNFLKKFPSKEQIREVYLMKEFRNTTFMQIVDEWKIINWKQLIKLLTNSELPENASIEIYFYDALDKGFKNLEEFGSKKPMELNNAILGLYAQQIYQQMVLSKRNEDREKYCVRTAANLLRPEASNLYLSTFSSDELQYMNETIQNLFEELKETLRETIKNETWIEETEYKKLFDKINSLKVIAPAISYFTHNDSIYNLTEIYLTDNYVNNSMNLMQNFWARIWISYPGRPEQIWTYYTTPFQSKGLAIRELNLVVIPFGAIDWSAKYDEPSFYYIKLATLGTTIAHQIAHHFDANGIKYLNDVSSLQDIFAVTDYIQCQRNLYENRMEMTLLSTGQTVYYKISQLTLNERLSETMGLRLAYDTLDRLRSRDDKEVHLPWLELVSDQLFYLTYAQMHCTKLPLTSSYISLYEDEQLPSRIRIFVTASNDRLLGNAWKCASGSNIIPSLNCGVFPHLPNSSYAITIA